MEKLKTISPQMIILFGSHANGNATEDSDIDLFVVTNDDFMPKNFEEKINYRLSIKKIIRETIKKTPVDLLIYTKPMFEKFKNIDSSFSREILQNGKKLYESNN